MYFIKHLLIGSFYNPWPVLKKLWFDYVSVGVHNCKIIVSFNHIIFSASCKFYFQCLWIHWKRQYKHKYFKV